MKIKLENFIKNNKRIVVALLLIVVTMLGISYGYWQSVKTQTGTNRGGTVCFDLEFDETIGISLLNAIPMTDEKGLETTPYTFTITNMCTVYAVYQVNLESLIIESPETAINPKFIKAVLDYNNPYIVTDYKEVETTLVDADSSYKMITGGLATGDHVTYNLRIWLDYETELDDLPGISDEETEYAFRSKIVIIAVPEKERDVLAVSENDCPGVGEAFLGSPGAVKRGNIETITFTNTNIVPGDAIGWSVSANDSVMAWYKAGTTGGMYDVWIGAVGGVSANADSSYLFAGMKNLKSIDFTYFDESTARNAVGMFFETGEDNAAFTLGDLSGWNVSNITDMMGMFAFTGASSTVFTIGDLSGWDVSAVTDMSHMFISTGESSATFTLGNLNSWNVSKVRDMSYMFKNSGYSNVSFSLGNLSNWKVANVINMSHMFDGTGKSNPAFTLNLSNWDIKNVSLMEGMFKNTTYLTELRLDEWAVPAAMQIDMFDNSNNRTSPNHLKIYVKNSDMETWITTFTSMPSNAVVNIVP